MRASRRQAKRKPIKAIPAGGVCTVNEPWLIGSAKCQSAVNMMLIKGQDGKGGYRKQWRTRPGAGRITSQPLPDGRPVKAARLLKGTTYLASDQHLYRLDGQGAPLLVGEVATVPRLLAYAGLLVVLDGGYLKSVDPGDGHAYGILWDEDGFLWGDWGSGDAAGAWSLHAGGTTRAGFLVTAPAWGPGEIPLNEIRAALYKSGVPTGAVALQVWSADGATLLGTGTLQVEDLPSEALIQDVDIEAEAGRELTVAASEDRYVSVEFSGGDGNNAVHLQWAEASGAGAAVTWNGAQWQADGDKDPLLAVGPGLPPRASWGAVKSERLVVGGGNWPLAEDAAKLGYSGLNNPYKWGARQYNGADAGWIGVERGVGGSINGLVKFFTGLFVSKAGPASIHRLSGSVPGFEGDLRMDEIFQELGALAGLSMANVGNNILFLADQVLGLEGVQGYGDVRQWPRSENVADLVELHKSENAFACYHANHDQYWLQLEGLPYTMVLHVLLGDWSFYLWEGFTPTCFLHQDDQTYVGGDDGHFYQVDDAVIGQDGGAEWSRCEVWGPMNDFGDGQRDKHVHGFGYMMSARMGATAKLRFKLDYQSIETGALQRDLSVPIDAGLTVKELTLPVEDWIYPPTGQSQALKHHDHQFVCKAVQAGVTDIDPGGDHVYLGSFVLDTALLGVS